MNITSANAPPRVGASESRDVALHALQETDGFCIPFTLSGKELSAVRQMLTQQLRSHLAVISPECESVYRDCDIQQYHLISHLFDHHRLMKMEHRNLPQAATEAIQDMPFFRKLMDWFENATIEDPLGYRINWRVSRPGEASDTFPAHADQWYFANYEGISDTTLTWATEEKNRLKWVSNHSNQLNFTVIHVWIPVYCEPGRNGLLVAPGSHLKNWQYERMAEGPTGTTFPKFELLANETVNLELLPTEPGEVLLFHDRLLHQGAVNEGENTRVSLLFNIPIKNEG